ncbi:collagen-like protein [Deinococcus xianganensis]|uniref:Collagen-like protein n=1 Tax=Deinococcus xianganensis TaxID=1507289 RepID=A0A6I4YD81_9DEIO|nr:collagen-like protein [Deinococcus xianganensis]MXV20299.1 hypothetical protein [Deinococcus xianganensis]
MTTPPPTPPDPALWTWTDTFDRTFLGPDYTAASGVSISSNELRFGPMPYAPENAGLTTQPTPGTLSAALATTRFQQADIQLQFDWRYAWTSTAGAAPVWAGIALVGGGRILRLANGRLEWGYDQPNGAMTPLGGFSTAPPANTWQRVTLTVDTTQGRIQALAGHESIDAALPDDYLAAMGSAQLRLIARQREGTNQPPSITVWVDNLAIRSGDGTADLSTGTANSSGGIRLGGEWRFAPGPPDDSVGSEGDVWADSITGTISRKAGGVYVNAMTLLGAPGPQGEQGPQGPPGIQGPAGRDGLDGQPGELVGAVAVPLLLGDATPDGGLLIPLNPGPGSLIGYELLGVDGPAVLVEHASDGSTWVPVAFPFVLPAGVLRLTRTDDSGAVAVLRARSQPAQGGGSSPGFTVQTDPDGFPVYQEAQISTDPDGYLTVTNATATTDPEGYMTLERTS